MGATLSSPTDPDPDGPKTFDIALVGLVGAGKTSFIDRLKRLQQAVPPLPQTTPTIGYISDEIPYRKHTLTLWVFSAPAQLESGHLGRWRPCASSPIHPCNSAVYWNVHAFIFVVDAAKPEHFPNAEKELLLSEEIRRGGFYSSADPVLVVANKMDKIKSDVGMDLAETTRALDIEGLLKWGRVIALKVSRITWRRC
ncbi:hypothetical protein C8R44DRAFT_199733 [Mycena epipterygia]|nr:hypothetical protein C8R44DRAFT_199733 [Mycena epipterygia]